MLRVEAMKREDQQDEDNPGHVSIPHNFSHHIISLGPVAVQQCTVGQIRVFCPMGVLGVFI